MDLRSFIAGVACGAIIAVAAGWFLAGGDEEEVAAQAEPDPVAASVFNLKPDESTAPNASEAKAAADDPSAPETPTTNANRVEGAVPWPTNQWQKLELESKDDSWAYYMEQTLLEFLGSHPAAAQFDISRIECRTTICQLEVVGYDASTQPVWEQVMYEIRNQPWSDFARYGSSSGNVNDSFVLIGTFWRVPTEQ